MTSYQVEIPNSKLKSYQLVTFFIAAANALAFGYYYINTLPEAAQKGLIGIGFLVAGGGFLFFILNRFTHLLRGFIIEIAFFICAACWLLTQNYFLGVMLLLFAVIGLMTKKKPVIIFSETGIVYPSFPSGNFPWEEVAWVMLKDGILSIELENNRLMQFTLDPKIYVSINQENFNSFCKARIRPDA